MDPVPNLFLLYNLERKLYLLSLAHFQLLPSPIVTILSALVTSYLPTPGMCFFLPDSSSAKLFFFVFEIE